MNSHYLMNNYGERALSLVRGEGVYVWDDQGNRYLDSVSGVAVCGLGHCHPAVTQAMIHQTQTLVHSSNLYLIPQQQELAEKLCTMTGMESVFFSNSGAEANEAAIKLARLYGHKKGIDLPTIIVMETAFHGRTLATLSATAGRKVQAGFEPLVSGFVRAPYNDVASVRKIAANNSNVCAILVEPIQGESGIRIPDASYLAELRKICDQHGWLLMLDEIQTGNGRTGTYFAFQGQNVMPDIVTTAKGLGNGVPIGACMARGVAAGLFGPGSHGSTYGGNPLVCAAANSVVDTIQSERLANNAAHIGQLLLQKFQAQLGSLAHVKEVRGKGLMIGIELTAPCKDLVAKAANKGLLLNVTADCVVRLLPALVYSEAQAEEMSEIVIALIRDWQPAVSK